MDQSLADRTESAPIQAAPGPTTIEASICRVLPVLGALAGYAIFLFARGVLNDADTYTHLAAGEWMLQHGRIAYTDPLSGTFAGAPWVAHEWLAEVLTALAFRAGGWDGVVMLHGAAFALTLGMLAHHLKRWVDGFTLLLLFVLGASCIAPSMLARPHILALPVMEFWVAAMAIARSRQRAPSPALLPLMVLWANLHGGFAFGLAIIGPFAVEAFLEAGQGRMKIARQWGLFFLGAVAASLVTPHGWQGLMFPFHYLQMKAPNQVVEWQPTSIAGGAPIGVALMTALYAAYTRDIRLPTLRLVMALGLLYLALAHGRHQMVAGIVGPLILAEPLARALRLEGYAGRSALRGSRIPGLTSVGAGLVLMAALTVQRTTHPIVRVDDRASPISALQHVPAEIAHTPVFNEYSFGGYLAYMGVPPFIDGRNELYGDAFVATYGQIQHPDWNAFTHAVEKYGIRWTILAPNSPLAALLDLMPGWRRLYADRFAVVHVRTGAAP